MNREKFCIELTRDFIGPPGFLITTELKPESMQNVNQDNTQKIILQQEDQQARA